MDAFKPAIARHCKLLAPYSIQVPHVMAEFDVIYELAPDFISL
jgi:hypothetical protein